MQFEAEKVRRCEMH